jgi:hypothetical protein
MSTDDALSSEIFYPHWQDEYDSDFIPMCFRGPDNCVVKDCGRKGTILFRNAVLDSSVEIHLDYRPARPSISSPSRSPLLKSLL